MKKSFNAVIHPEQFIPHLQFNTPEDFDSAWKHNRTEVFAYLSHVAYFDKEKIETFLQSTGIQKVCYFDSEGAQAYLAIWHNKATLIFRGSQLKERTKSANENVFSKWIKSFLKIAPWSFLRNDVLADLFFIQTSITNNKSVKVHSGFKSEVDKLWGKEIKPAIEAHTKGLPIWVSGHSLGAAMATISSLLYPFEALITFGSPRVGKNIDEGFLAKKHTRVVNGLDPVTMLPPKWLFGYKFKHHGEETKVIGSDGKKNIIYDHGILYYSQNLQNLNSENNN